VSRPVIALVVALQLSCSGPRLHRTTVPPTQASQLDGEARWLKVHMHNGDVYVFRGWRVDEAAGTVTGTGDHHDPNRNILRSGTLTVALADVALLESNKVEREFSGLGVLVVLSAAVTIACLTNPKACFGSCPTFYVGEPAGRPIAEGFSSSIAPSLEASDVDALWFESPSDGRFVLTVTNEALETHVIRRIELMAASRPSNGRVVADPDGVLYQAHDLRPAARCRDAAGDCTGALAAADGIERSSAANERDLATREVIELAFPDPGPGPHALVIGGRQSFLSTFLLYQILGWMGRDAGAYLAALERGDADLLSQLESFHDLLGAVEVQFLDGATWRTAGSFDETGPIATDVQLVPLPPGVSPERLRLRLTQGHWRIDFVALARLGDRVEPIVLQPSDVESPVADASDRLRSPGDVLVSLPGDRHVLEFELPEAAGELELFIRSRGYYLEWMRKEWLEEENPAAVALTLAYPGLMMRMLAPAFKEVEPTLEDTFWKSRYAPPPGQ
jgi:hypothetical protein